MKIEKKNIKSVLKYAVSVAVTVSLILFAIYHSFGGFSETLSTVISKIVTESETLTADGYIFRDEKVLYSEYKGAVKHLTENGAYVSVGDDLAVSYSNPTNIDVYARKAELEQRKALLNSCLELKLSDVQDAEKQSSETFKQILDLLSKGNAYEALYQKQQWIEYLAKLQVFDGNADEREERIKNELLTIEKEILELDYCFSGASKTVNTSVSGYYFYKPDGYEEVYSSELIEELTLDKFNELKNTEPANVEGAVGKLVYDFEWYLTVPVSAETAYKMTVGRNYKVSFTEERKEINMYLEKRVDAVDSDEVLLVFSTTTMPENFSYKRIQSIKITHSEISGYSVPASAMRMIDGVQGVYIFTEGNVYFRRVNVIKNCDGYYIVAERDTNAENYREFLNLNDSIIISGKNLYDGKVIGK